MKPEEVSEWILRLEIKDYQDNASIDEVGQR